MAAERLDYKQAAALVGVKPKTWLSYVARGQAPAPRKDPKTGRNYWLRSTVEKWMENRTGQGVGGGGRRPKR